MSPVRSWALRSALWLLLGGWVGSWILFPLVALTAFHTLPSTELAGLVVAPLLAGLHLFGAGAGVALALLGRALRRGPLLVALPLVLTALCLYSQFGVSAQISEVRDLAFGPEGSVEAAARFSLLHRRSTLLFYTVIGGALALLTLHARADSLAPPGGDSTQE